MGRIEENLGSRLLSLRKKAGLSQQSLADAARMGVQTVSRYERGEIAPSVDALERMARAMRIPITAFFGKDDAIPDLRPDLLKVVTLLEEHDPATVNRVHRALKLLLQA